MEINDLNMGLLFPPQSFNPLTSSPFESLGSQGKKEINGVIIIKLWERMG